jgi:hypothetical protein
MKKEREDEFQRRIKEHDSKTKESEIKIQALLDS